MTLAQASRQWAIRPKDERFTSLADLETTVKAHRIGARKAELQYNTLRVQPEGDDLVLRGPTGTTAQFTNWSFGQLAAYIHAPAQYIRTLPAKLASDNINYNLSKMPADDKAVILLGGDMTARAVTSPRYSRIWDVDIVQRLVALTQRQPQWQPAPAAKDGSRGLYASDHDIFCFLVDNDRRVMESLPGGGLSRGFFIWNSEVGAASFGITTFLYAYICGNHMVWGAKVAQELRIRHVGTADSRVFGELAIALRDYNNTSPARDEAAITAAQGYSLGTTRQEVLDTLAPRTELTQSQLAKAYDLADTHSDWYGSPRSLWGMVSGITELSQQQKHTDTRVRMDRAAGKLMSVVF